jgi:hypothetical protein
MPKLQIPKPPLTHAQLVQRGAMWLRNRKNCRVVLAEQTTGRGEIADVVGWKFGNCSFLLECKVSRGDFFADRCKPFRVDPSLGMGSYRYFLAPTGVLAAEDVAGDWGLLEVRGRSIFVLKEAQPQVAHNHPEEVALLVQALAQAQLRVSEPLHLWLTAPDSPVGEMRARQKALHDEMKPRECSYYPLPRGGGAYVQAVPCHTLVANGYSRCSEHGGKSRKAPRGARDPGTSKVAA